MREHAPLIRFLPGDRISLWEIAVQAVRASQPSFTGYYSKNFQKCSHPESDAASAKRYLSAFGSGPD